MDFSLELKRILNDKNTVIENKYKIWLTKNKIVVLDIKAGFINIAFDIVKSEKTIKLLVFGRDSLSRKAVEDFVIPVNEWSNKIRISGTKVLVKEWDTTDDLEFIATNLINLANIICQQLQDFVSKETFSMIQTIKNTTFKNVKKRVSQKNVMEIGFLVSERQKWNCQSLWDILNKVPQIKCRIFLNVYKKEQIDDQLDFFRKIDPDLICLYDFKTKKNKQIKAYNLDLIFCQQPWTGLSGQSRAALETSLILYMHYGFLVYANSKMQYQLWDFHPFIWRYLSQSELQKKIHLEYDPSMAGRQVVTGYPKLDVYLDTPTECSVWAGDKDKAKIIYAPHHSMQKNALRISTFPWNFDLLLELSQQYRNETLWAYKPHARLKYSAIENNIMTAEEYDSYVNTWSTQSNTTVYDDGNYFDLFRSSDVMITDCGSFLGEYFPTGKPIIWLVSDNARVELNAIGKKLSKGFYIVKSREELISVFNDVVIQGNDPLKDYRENVIKEVFSTEQKSATSIVNYLMETFELK